MDLSRREFIALSGMTLASSLISLENLSARPMGIPVIMYHDISHRFNDPYTMSPADFAAQMEWLYAHGYQAISLKEARSLAGVDTDKTIIITFDDGYASFMDHAFSLLQGYGFRATINIIGKYVGTYVAPNRPMLSWDEYRYLTENDYVDLGCHTYHLHSMQKNVLTVSGGEIEKDLILFLDVLKKETGQGTDILAWPYGRFNERSMKIAQKVGFKYILTSNKGLLFEESAYDKIPRLNIDHNLDLLTFRRQIQKIDETKK